jgi:hypothetical protein
MLAGGGNALGVSQGFGEAVFGDIIIDQEVDATRIKGIETGKLLHVRNELSNGTSEGTATTSYGTRNINTTVLNEIANASLSSNQITLPAGTYYIDASVPGANSAGHRARLQNTTDATTAIIGTAGKTNSGTQTNSHSFLKGKFTVVGTKVFEVQHISQNAGANGLGYAGVAGTEVEIFTDVKIWKVDA